MPTFKPNDEILNKTYRIVEGPKCGAFGEVYVATYLPLGILRAVKVVRKGDGIGSNDFKQFRERFVLEASLGASLHYSNIIHVNQFEEENNELFLVMDYAPNGSLADQIIENVDQGSVIPIEKVVKWVCESASGLMELHKKDIVHRDIKPSNILLDADQHACIADLGLVQLPTSRFGGSSMGFDHPGTPEYMPPEQRPGHTMPLKASADVYALGCVLFELLTGRQYYHHEGERVKSLRNDIPFWLDAVVAKAVQQKPEDRYQNAGEMFTALQNLPDFRWKKYLIPVIIGLTLIGVALITIKSLTDTGWNGSTPPANIDKATPLTTKEPDTARSAIVTSTQPKIETPIESTVVVSDTVGYSPNDPTKDGMTMVYVPAGDFLMGSPYDVGDSDEHPQHSVYLDAFWIDKTEVTNEQYGMCVQAGECSEPYRYSSSTRSSYFSNSKFKDYPVIYVDWNQANTYCIWAGRALPTEAQWEKAARGTAANIYPWGNSSINGSFANFADISSGLEWASKSIDDGYPETAPVGSFPDGESIYGVQDMAGNVWEWVSDWYDSDYYAVSQSKNPKGPNTASQHFLRGGSWGNTANVIRSANRNIRDETPADEYSGFRCVIPQ